MQNTVRPAILTEDTAAEAPDTVLKLDKVSKCFKQWQRSGRIKDIIKNLISPVTKNVLALDNVSLEIKRGEFVAYAGANGAGKSTTLKLLSGILKPSSGSIKVLGLNPSVSRIELMRRIGIVFGQRTELWWDQPVSQSFDWKQAVWNIPINKYKKVRDMVIELLDLKNLMNTFARDLSLGQRMRADLGLMLLHEPELILLDEPTLGLDVLAKRQMINFLKDINRENKTTIVVTSHDMDDLEEMAQRIILLSSGRIAFDGSFDDLRQQTGSMRRITLTTKTSGAPRLSFAHLVSSNHNIHDYEFDSARISVKDLLKEISGVDGVIDVETGKVPIEKLIADLYVKWKK